MFPIIPSDPTPIYAQLERAIRAAIATGGLREGDRLPTVRQMAVDLKVNANTVAKVYAELERAGVVETKRGVGTFIRPPSWDHGGAADRERALVALENRFLAEAQALGYAVADVIHHLQGRQIRELP